MENSNIENFDLEKTTDMSPNALKEYIKRFVFPTMDGLNIVVSYKNNEMHEYKTFDKSTIKTVIFSKLSKEINTFYFTEYKNVREIVCEISKPFLYDKCINLCPQIISKRNDYDSYPPEIKKKVNIMLDLLKSIWCNGHDNQYQFLLKWFSNLVRGNKNQSCLYNKAIEGIGKSTFTDFFIKYVIGERLVYKGGSSPITSNFNAILMGKLLIVFEELENFSTAQWSLVSSRLKRDLTSDTKEYERKGVDSIVTKNFSNIIINSNVDAIKDTEGRRIYISEFNTFRKGDYPYFKMVTKECYNLTVGEAFYNYLIDKVNIDDYHDQDFPVTQAKLDAYAKRLDVTSQFLKYEYVLKKKNINNTLADFYDEFKSYCSFKDKKPITKIDFHSKLKELQIKSYRSNLNIRIKYSIEDLEKLADKNKWIHETDELNIDDDDDDSEDEKENPLDQGIIKDNVCKKDVIIKDLQNQNNELLKQLEELKKQFASLTAPIPEPEPEPIIEDEIIIKTKKSKKSKTKVIKQVEEQSDEDDNYKQDLDELLDEYF
jgi:hypothetical protein